MANTRRILGDYLAEIDPVALLWIDMVKAVYGDSPRQGCLDRLGPAARLLYQVGCFEAEVINGGFRQYLSAHAGDCLSEALDALRQIGASVCAGLVEQALSLFPDRVAPVDRHRRCGLLFALDGPGQNLLDELSQQFSSRVDAISSEPEEDLNALQLAFMTAHLAEPVLASGAG